VVLKVVGKLLKTFQYSLTMTNEQSKIDQQVREIIRQTMETFAPYEQARAFAYVQTLRKNYSHMDDDQFLTFINKKILAGQ